MATFQGLFWLAKPTVEFVGASIAMGRGLPTDPAQFAFWSQPMTASLARKALPSPEKP